MKLFVKLMLALLVLALLLPFTLLKDDRGNTLMSFSDFNLDAIKMPDFSMPEFADLPSTKNLVPSGDGSGDMDHFYKWYDAQGNVHFTTEPPADGIDYTVKEFDPNANVIQAVELPEAETEARPEETQAEPREAVSPTTEPVSAYDPEQIKKLFEDTENIEKLLQQRMEQQNSAFN